MKNIKLAIQMIAAVVIMAIISTGCAVNDTDERRND